VGTAGNEIARGQELPADAGVVDMVVVDVYVEVEVAAGGSASDRCGQWRWNGLWKGC
jgi:hypothetical protein